jgi:two-component system, OmpR family, response regulator TctD
MARILVVDDLPDVARAIARMLHNHETVVETDPRRAIARIVGGRFDVVLVDFDMPYMTGRAVSDALAAAQLARPPIVLVMSGSENVASLYATGRAVLIKPFSGDELRDLVSTMLHEHAELAEHTQHHPGA